MQLDLAGIAASLGSACASGSTRPSPTLMAMRVPDDRLRSSVRFSLGATTTEAEIDEAVRRIAEVVGCHSVRKARERRKRLELGNLSSRTLRVNESRPAELGQQPEASLAWRGVTLTAKRRQRVPMPCDRAPKYSLAGALVVDTSGGRAEHAAMAWRARSCRGPRAGRRDTRGPREPGRPCPSPPTFRLGRPEHQLPGAHGPASRAAGSEQGARVVSPSEGNEVRRDGRRESERLIVPMKRGNRPRDPVEGRGRRVTNRWRETWRVHRNPWTCPRNNNG